jgi:phospholipid transport system substrate-binding protein
MDAPGTVKSLCDAVLAGMKQGSSLNFAARRDLLAPEIRRDLDLAFMTRIVVGPAWRSLAAPDRQQLVEAFSDFSIATYAERFRSYSGERFEVDPSPSPQPNGDSIVHTKLFTGGPDPVQLDYLLRKSDDQWRIIDVYLNGTISEMAARRSEYSTVLRQGGAPALVELLKKKAVDLGNYLPGSS